MARRSVIEKWMKKHSRTKKPMYFMHRLYPNGNIGDKEQFASRSGRSRRINKMLELEPDLIIRNKVA